MNITNRLRKLEERLAQKPGDRGDVERSPESEAMVATRLAELAPSFEAAAGRHLVELGEEHGFDGDDLSPLAKQKAAEFIESFRRGDSSAALPKPKRRR